MKSRTLPNNFACDDNTYRNHHLFSAIPAYHQPSFICFVLAVLFLSFMKKASHQNQRDLEVTIVKAVFSTHDFYRNGLSNLVRSERQ